MNSRQVLLPLYRALRPIVDRLKLNRIARPIWGLLWKTGTDSLVYAEQNGRNWWLDPSVASRGKYQEMETIIWLRSVVSEGMTVIDVGANVGQMTLEMAQLVGPSGRVIAIEPAPGNLAVLRRHVAANGFSARVEIVAAACCALDQSRLEISVPTPEPDGISSG